LSVLTKKNQKVYYTINRIQDLNSVVIPHFLSYPLQSDKKKIDFDLWAEIVRIIISKKHLTKDGLLRILSLKTILNRGLSKKLISEFPDVINLSRPLLELSTNSLNNHWIAGFTAAEGSFSVTINEKDGRKLPQVRARFSIGLHARDINILTRISNQFNTGNIYSNNKGTVLFQIANLTSIKTKLIPLFDEHNLNNIKHFDFLDFKQIICLMENREHLRNYGLNTIREIKSNMNLRRM